ncbi:MAG: hypothetical protein BroJett038_32270 [Chloroflexota bacterium]|nr:MAG: hypothetical protein BroJett038_32270 [Chloroflexota bacterium]
MGNKLMTKDIKRDYRFLDGEADRQALVEDIRRMRREVLRLADLVPEARWYEPRYHGWSLAAMLGHLQLTDTLTLRLMQIALLGIRLPVSEDLLNRFNDLTARLFKQRLVPTTLRGLQHGEKRIVEFVLHLPMDKFTRLVYHPSLGTYLTLEQAMQEFFYYHWQGHLQTMREVEDIFYEPPQSTAL